MKPERLVAAAALLRIAFRHHPWWTSLVLGLAGLDAVRVPAGAAVSGWIVGVVSRGGEPGALVGPLLAFAALHAIPVGEFRWRLSDVIGNRIGDVLDERVIRAYLDPPGIGHLDDPGVRDAADRAATFWNSSVFEGVLSVLVARVQAVLAALLLGAAAGWPVAVIVSAAWFATGRWAWRVAGRGLDVQFDQSEELRDAAYSAGIGIDPAQAKDVRVFGLTDWLLDRHARLWHTAMAPLWARRRRDVAPSAAVAVIASTVTGAALVWLATRAIDGGLTPASLAVAVHALVHVRGLGLMPYGHWEMEYGLRAVPANDELVRRVHDVRFALAGDRTAEGMPAESIRFEGVRFAYPGRDEPVLDGVDLDIPAGSSLAVVGPNGAGKTTMVKLLCRFLDPSAGRIVVDGVPLDTIDPSAWHERIAGLFQDFVRYPLTARDNVAADERVPLEVVRDAAASAGIADVVDALPAGWDTQLTRAFAGGVDLSGGEWQRIALARALLGVRLGAGLLVLDEPTAHLDAKAEADLYDRFLDLTAGVTTVLISHRFSTVRRADRIAVLDHGRVVECGTHDELAGAGGTYAAMFAVQAAKFA